MGILTGFDATYLKANDPITKRALWIREQRIGTRVWRWCVLTDPGWKAPRIIFSPPPTRQSASGGGEGQGEGAFTCTSPSPQPSPDGRGGLYWDDPSTPLRLMPAWMYYLPLRTKYESLCWNGRVSGEIYFEGRRTKDEGRNASLVPRPSSLDTIWRLTRWPAQQGHLWGGRISKEWAWAHGNCFTEDPTATFEILTSGGRTLLCLRSQLLNYTANTVRTWRSTRHELTPTHWNWEFAHDDLKIVGHFQLGYAPMATIDYPTPQGDTRTCHNTKVGCGSIAVSRAGKPLLQLTAHDTLAWEFVGSP